MGKTLTFEEPIVKLREKIKELEEFTTANSVDLSMKLKHLKIRLEKSGRRNLRKYGTMGSCSSCKTSRASNDT